MCYDPKPRTLHRLPTTIPAIALEGRARYYARGSGAGAHPSQNCITTAFTSCARDKHESTGTTGSSTNATTAKTVSFPTSIGTCWSIPVLTRLGVRRRLRERTRRATHGVWTSARITYGEHASPTLPADMEGGWNQGEIEARTGKHRSQ